MTAEQFAYWLQGFAELTEGTLPTPEQWKSINDHLNTVFVKVTPKIDLTPLVRFERSVWPHHTIGQPLITC